MNTPTNNPTEFVSSEWFESFPVGTDVYRLSTGAYYAGDGDDLIDTHPDAIIIGQTHRLAAEWREVEEALEPAEPTSTSMTGAELRAIRTRLSMTQGELGKALDLHRDHVGRMERGESPITKVTELAINHLAVGDKLTRDEMIDAVTARLDSQIERWAEPSRELRAAIERGKKTLERHALRFTHPTTVPTLADGSSPWDDEIPDDASGTLLVSAGYIATSEAYRLAIFRPRR